MVLPVAVLNLNQCKHLQVIEASVEKLQPANPDILEGVDDLTQLTYLNQPAILHNIASRYQRDIIYVSMAFYM